ncbi:MAG: hypothetical protein JWO95_1183 [Verrucomicrobiales bacterium]|nr:hypothetical protein [Verrucomicrobiales bacterium]
MSKNFAAVADEALQLPQQEQLRLARTLLEHAEPTADTEAEATWEDEIERRIKLIDSGVAKGRPYKEVLRDTDRRLNK